MITVKMLGVEAIQGEFKTALAQFQKAKLVQMRAAVKLVRNEARARAKMLFPPKARAGKRRMTKTTDERLGPLARQIYGVARKDGVDVRGVIAPGSLAFYGRFLERGVSKTVKRTSSKGRKSEYFLRIRATPYLEPAASANETKVVAILGEAYSVFQESGGLGTR